MVVVMGHYDSLLRAALRTIGYVDRFIVQKKPGAALSRAKKAATLEGVPLRLLRRGQQTEEVLPLGSFDMLLVGGFGRTITKPLINRVKWVVNFHPGLLPECRGHHPLPCAILAGHKFMGITAHIIDSEAIDAGPIIARVSMPIDYSADYETNDRRIRFAMGTLGHWVLSEYIHTGTFPSVKQPAGGTYYRPLPPPVLERIFQAKRVGDMVGTFVPEVDRER